jgi:uncharacterized protein (TIGR02594 family)
MEHQRDSSLPSRGNDRDHSFGNMATSTQQLRRIEAIASRISRGFSISGPVGSWARGADNKPTDVETIQYLLEYAGKKDKRLELDPHGIDGKISRTQGRSGTVRAIIAFQKSFMQKPDGLVDVDGITIEKLRAYAISDEPRTQGVAKSVMQVSPAGDGMPPWLGSVTNGPALNPLLPTTRPNQPAWVSIAEKELGIKEKKARGEHEERIVEFHSSTTTKKKTDENPWCASFVNWVVEKAGFEGTGSAWSHSWKRWGDGLTKPAIGAVAVIDWGLVYPGDKDYKGKGHVGFVVGKSATKRIVLLGGNQGDMVKYAGFKKKHIVAYRVPKGFKVPDEYYRLPILKIEPGGGGFDASR